MDYQKHYNNLIARAQNRVLEGYFEKHHIVPRCLNGTNDIENLVALTPEEHYVAHQLLVKMHPDHRGLIAAMVMMGATRNTNKLYGWARRKYAQSLTENTGWVHSEETKAKIAEALRGQLKSKKTRKKMSVAKKGKRSWKKGMTGFNATAGSWKKGNTPWNVGKPAYEYAVEIDGVIYRSRKIAAQKLNKDMTTIMRWLKNGKAIDRSAA